MDFALEYHLRDALCGHGEDVRAICVDGTRVFTASRDKTLIVWDEDNTSAGMGRYRQLDTLVGHSNYVTAVAWLPSSLAARYPNGAAVSGSRDNSVIVWDTGSCKPDQALEGHSYQVTSVAIGEEGSIVSASLDKTLRVWDANTGGSSTLEGHEGPVLCCIVLTGGDILSGSGDATIRRWNGGRCVATLRGHTDTVRGLAEFPNLGFVSASHDQTLKVWTYGGELAADLIGHQALVYAAAVVAETLVASASEDRTCRIWKPDGECLQTIEHPSCVWSVAAFSNGDVVTACGDHQAYIWSKDPSRKASEEAVAAFEASLPAAKGSGDGGGSSLPAGLHMEPPEALLQPGRPGQTKVISENGTGIAYTWDVATGTWEKIGQVVGDPGAGDSNMAVGSKFYGQMWDYVFDVDVADNAPPLKLPVNRGDNPYAVADRFIAENGLPDSYKDQIVQFVLQNTDGGVTLPGTFADPFTGANAYVPSGTAAPRAPAPAVPMDVTGGGVDPFTGGSSARARLVHCPLEVHMLWPGKLANPAAIKSRIAELNSAVGEAMLPPADLAEGPALDSLLKRSAEGDFEGAGETAAFTDAECEVLDKLLSWPGESLYPAMDVARLVALTGAGAARLAAGAGAAEAAEGPSLGAAVARALSGRPPSPASQQTCLKLLSNCCRHEPLKSWLLSQAEKVLDMVAGCADSPKPAVQLAHATLLMNMALLVRRVEGAGDRGVELKTQLLMGLMEALNCGRADEQLFRALVAVGTLLSGDAALQATAKDLGVGGLAGAAASRATQGKVREAAADVEAILSGKA